MAEALRSAKGGARRGEVPVGAVLIREGVLVARGANRTIRDTDPSAHAEVVTLRRAARKAGNHRLAGATLYVTLEPCPMCIGALVQARVRRVVFGAPDPKGGAVWLLEDPAFLSRINHRFKVAGGILAEEASRILKTFFLERRRQSAATRTRG
jgi:tRNA(adenine34) deaminase